MLSSLFLIVPLFAFANAANDWSVPCITGECSYDIPATNGSTASGTMTIWGSQNAITDITTAADWEIWDCDPNALAQDIRLVCKSDAADSNCSHLYQNTGAVNKLVRLPESCGGSAFARVSKAWVPEDQSIPSSIAARPGFVSSDTDFGAADWSQTGPGANVPGAAGTIQVPPSKRSTRISQRGLFGFVKNAIKCMSFLGAFSLGLLQTNSIDVNKNVDLPPLDLNKKINLVNKSIQCGPVTAKVNADLDGSVHAVASVGVAAQGNDYTPKGLNANVVGTLSLTADVAGTIDSGKIQLITLGIPGFDIPGVFSLGPTFTVDAQATASLDVNLDLETKINLDIKNAQLHFPAGSGDAPNANAFSIGDIPLTLSASPDVKATGTVAVHLIPALNFGVSAFGNLAKAEIDLALDTSASLKLSLEASAKAATTIDKSSSTSAITTKATTKSTAASSTVISAKSVGTASSSKIMHDTTSTSAKAMHTTSSSKMVHKSTSTSAKSMHTTTSTKAMAHKASSTSKAMHTSASTKSMAHSAAASPKPSAVAGRAVTANFSGCFEADAGLAITAGVEGDLQTGHLVSKNFVIFKKCFGTPAPAKRSLFVLSRLDRPSSLGRRAGLSCPAGGLASPASVVDQTIKAADIKAA
ncbi:hypothetical protein B0H14DRAFT_2783654 [Mycena olivaceomarginata]|nr:hypothetical protein B0H14DRAFT_2783654 [Mycena olivaceomarginata]